MSLWGPFPPRPAPPFERVETPELRRIAARLREQGVIPLDEEKKAELIEEVRAFRTQLGDALSRPAGDR